MEDTSKLLPLGQVVGSANTRTVDAPRPDANVVHDSLPVQEVVPAAEISTTTATNASSSQPTLSTLVQPDATLQSKPVDHAEPEARSASANTQPITHGTTAPVMSPPPAFSASNEERFVTPIQTQSGASTPLSPSTPANNARFIYPQPSQPEASSSKPRISRKLLSTHIAANPSHSVGKAIQTEFPSPNPLVRLARRFRVKHSVINGLTAEEMEKWQKQGAELRRKAGWIMAGEEGEGVVVSELFWKMYLSLLPTLERDPLSGLVPPDLLGSTTTMPISIISLIPDIMQHYRDVIIRARKEVFLATNYWQPSNSVNTISKSLRDLSALVIKEGREKVIVKVMYDRGSWEQLWNSHAPVNPDEWTPLDLPGKDDIPGLDMEVINFHRVLLGTFHAKFLIVDRKVALLNSNNIQDRPNLELMSHFEGPIVDSFYEVALHSWYNRLSPSLPCMSQPYEPPRDSAGRIRYLFQDRNPYLDDIEILKAAKAARELLRQQTKEVDDERLSNDGHPFREAVQRVVERQRQARADFAEWKPGEELGARAQTAMNDLREFREKWGLGGTSRQGSRANSRAPSRRASTDFLHRPRQYTEKEPIVTTTPGHGDLTSEAPSTPTVVGDGPAKSKTFPTPSSAGLSHMLSDHDDFSPIVTDYGFGKGDRIDDPPRERTAGRKGHVLFLETSGIDGSGRFLDSEGLVRSPLTTKSFTSQASGPLLGPEVGAQGITASPGATSAILPEETVGPEVSRQPESTGPEPITQDRPESAIIEDPTSPAQIREETVGSGTLPTAVTKVEMPAEADGDAPPRPELHRDDSEALPEGQGSKRLFKMSKMFNAAGVLSEAWATVEDSDELDNFRPHVVHKPHEPFPIAMCCRKPHGFPGHHDIRNPQNAAWLAGFRYAKKRVFVQTPTLNARPIVRAIKQTCRRGVEVVLLLDLGFNDKGESIPFQGGTNEEVVDRLYKVLCKEKKQQHLKVYWYTGKDQVRPLNAVKKQRNCHIKFAAYDDEVMIIGNGNQDSQSWFHSQEVNVMIDNKQVIAEMMDTLLSNQNTIKYGLVDGDGTWRDKDGKTLADYGITEKGAFRGLSGFIAFAKTI